MNGNTLKSFCLKTEKIITGCTYSVIKDIQNKTCDGDVIEIRVQPFVRGSAEVVDARMSPMQQIQAPVDSVDSEHTTYTTDYEHTTHTTHIPLFESNDSCPPSHRHR